MILKGEAVVLRRVCYANTSLVLTYHTREYGQVAVLAKGVRRPAKKGVYERAPDLFCTGELVWYPRRRGELGIQSAWTETADHPHLRRMLPSIRAGMRLIEVLAAITRDAEPMPEIFDQARVALASMDAACADAAAPPETVVNALGLIILYFDLHALRIAGLCPTLDRCVECGGQSSLQPPAPSPQPLARRTADWHAFSPAAGGLLCAACARAASAMAPDDPPLLLPAESVSVARYLLRSSPSDTARIQISRRAHRALRTAIDADLTYHLERAMRSFRPLAARRARAHAGSF